MNKISPVYRAGTKESGATVDHTEWNELSEAAAAAHEKINEVIDSLGGGTPQSGEGSDSHVRMTSKGNLSIETSEADLTSSGKGGKINIEPYSDLQVKPGDDIMLYSHHRDAGNQRELLVKVMNGSNVSVDGVSEIDDYPVELKVNAANLTLTTEDKDLYITEVNKERSQKGKDGTQDEEGILNVEVRTGVKSSEATRSHPAYGYLKVRGRAIDLRCEEHGGIALQPRGTDGSGHENKVKFEHGGGDGLEFCTFNTEKTSIFTNEYRFNKDGVWKMATREKEVSDKYDGNDETTHYKYTKQPDDFYDVIDGNDPVASTKDIIKTAHALNHQVGVHTKITDKGALEIGTSEQYHTRYFYETEEEAINPSPSVYVTKSVPSIEAISVDKYYSASDLEKLGIYDSQFEGVTEGRILVHAQCQAEEVTDVYIVLVKSAAPSIKIDSGAELKLGGILDFGSTFNFGETDNGIETQYKLTKKNNTKDCGKLKVVAVNNHASNSMTVESYNTTDGLCVYTVNPGETVTVAECSLLDIIKFVNWAKKNSEGPWSAAVQNGDRVLHDSQNSQGGGGEAESPAVAEGQ